MNTNQRKNGRSVAKRAKAHFGRISAGPGRAAAVTACLLGAGPCGQARAQSAPPAQTGMPANPATAPADKPWAPPANFGEWASGIKLGFQADAGIVVNTQSPNSGRNFGRVFDDASNRPVLNQLLLTASREVDPKATGPDIGFKLQLMYGSDARIVHTLGVFDQLIHDRNQLDVTEANVTLRLPGVFAGGLDLKAGIYPTPLGVELIDPRTNAFYSHSYIFNYGLPFKHTGVLATAHVSDTVDLYLGLDSGTNTSFGSGEDNDRPGGIAGIGFNNLLGGKLTVLALTHIGPEDSRRNTTFYNSAIRYYNDLVLTFKATEKLTLTTEANFVREEGFRAEAWGVAQYASYALSDTLTLNARGELFRDNSNFFVVTPLGNRDVVLAERGNFSRFLSAPSATTYGELTLGVTFKPSGLPAALSTAEVRPEIRYDRSLNGTKAFNDQKDLGAFTLAVDAVVGF